MAETYFDPSTETAPRERLEAMQLAKVKTLHGANLRPVIRYRLADRVRLDRAPCACGRSFARLTDGISGRANDMVTVRGINIFPLKARRFINRRSYP